MLLVGGSNGGITRRITPLEFESGKRKPGNTNAITFEPGVKSTIPSLGGGDVGGFWSVDVGGG